MKADVSLGELDVVSRERNQYLYGSCLSLSAVL
jgi:hypothetical protein